MSRRVLRLQNELCMEQVAGTIVLASGWLIIGETKKLWAHLAMIGPLFGINSLGVKSSTGIVLLTDITFQMKHMLLYHELVSILFSSYETTLWTEPN